MPEGSMNHDRKKKPPQLPEEVDRCLKLKYSALGRNGEYLKLNIRPCGDFNIIYANDTPHAIGLIFKFASEKGDNPDTLDIHAEIKSFLLSPQNFENSFRKSYALARVSLHTIINRQDNLWTFFRELQFCRQNLPSI